MQNAISKSKFRITIRFVSIPGCLILLSLSIMSGQSCPPPPECETPGRYVLWAKRNSAVIAQTELGQSVYLDSYSSQSDRVIKYELVSQVYKDGQWQIWYYDLADCGTCNVKPCTFSRSGGSITSSGNNYIMVSYDSSPLAGYVRGTHNGWECYKTQYGGYIIPGGSQINMNVYVVKVTILGADIPDDLISVQLQPSGLTGFMELALDGDTWHLIRQVSRSSGIHSESFDIPNLPEGEFDFVYASWCLEGEYLFDDLLDYHIRVLGTYNNTRYNIPYESDCTGSILSFYFTSGNCSPTPPCNWNSGPGRSGWLEETKENGSGKGASGNYYALEWDCDRGLTYEFRKIPTEGCPSCVGEALIKDKTVARYKYHTNLQCGDYVFVHTVGVRKVTDQGSGSSGWSEYEKQHWLDHYDGCSGCNKPISIGNKKVILLYGYSE
ncbi:MAG: hypothetical protein ACE15F_15875 [bacterium]